MVALIAPFNSNTERNQEYRGSRIAGHARQFSQRGWPVMRYAGDVRPWDLCPTGHDRPAAIYQIG
jgi:hypothetical protein